jgi:hypothetical protein
MIGEKAADMIKAGRSCGRVDWDVIAYHTVIARSAATKQSILSLRCDMDCFASLAMTRTYPSIQQKPAVHRHHAPCHVPRGAGCQQQDRAAEIGFGADPTLRNPR